MKESPERVIFNDSDTSNETTTAKQEITYNMNSGSLPQPHAPFVGRQMEIKQVGHYLADSKRPIIHFVGLGGVGKTRLALEVAAQQASSFANGVHFCSIARQENAHHSPESLLDYLATETIKSLNVPGLGPYGSRSAPVSTLLNILRNKEMLLIFDEYEHFLPEGEALLEQISGKAQAIKIIVTSRKELTTNESMQIPIQGLSFPEQLTLDDKEARAYDAFVFLCQKLRQIRPSFDVTPAALPAILRICQLTNGLPLAMELVATWSKLLSLPAIVDRIEQDLSPLLQANYLDRTERQANLFAICDYVWQGLNQAEKTLFSQLAVFESSFTLQSAEAITQGSLDTFIAFFDKFLLQKTVNDRLKMHAVIRSFAAGKLAEDTALATQVHHAHAKHYLAFLAHWSQELFREDVYLGMTHIASELDNIRQAWSWLSSHSADALFIKNIASALSRYFMLANLIDEGVRSLDVIIARGSSLFSNGKETQALQATVLAERARFLESKLRFDEAIREAQKAIELAKLCDEVYPQALGHAVWGEALWRQGNLTLAENQLRNSLELAESTDNFDIYVKCLNILGAITRDHYSVEEGLAWTEKALQISQENHYLWGQASVLNNLGNLYQKQRRLHDAETCYAKALNIYDKFDNPHGRSFTLFNLGTNTNYFYEYELAQDYFERVFDIQRISGDRRLQAFVNQNMGFTSHQLGRYIEAENYFAEALSLFRVLNQQANVASILSNLGWLYFSQGAYHSAARHYDKSREIYEAAKNYIGLGYVHDNNARLYLALGKHKEAHEYAKQAIAVAESHHIQHLHLQALLTLGKSLFKMGQLKQVEKIYEEVRRFPKNLLNDRLESVFLSGLAQLADKQNNPSQMLKNVELLLQHLDSVPLYARDDMTQICLVCYRCLLALGDSRAMAVLAKGYFFIQEEVTQIEDSAMQKSFLGNITANVYIIQEYERRQNSLVPKADLPILTKREQEIMLALIEGLSNHEIGAKYYISLNTVKRHVSNIYGKLEVRNRTQAVAKARELGFV